MILKTHLRPPNLLKYLFVQHAITECLLCDYHVLYALDTNKFRQYSYPHRVDNQMIFHFN